MHSPARLLAALFISASTFATADDRPSAIIAVGAAGDTNYGEVFAKWSADWESACEAGKVRTTKIAPGESAPSERERLQKALQDEPKSGTQPLWVVLLGHGTYDGKVGKFNLAGEDVSVEDLKIWLQPFQRTVVIVAGFSASGAWLKPLSAPGRVIITATKSGTENNFSRLAGNLGAAFRAGADLDKDGETSLLEAWLAAARKTADFYSGEGRLATEHSLLDDNGDGQGTPGDWYTGVRPNRKPQGKAQIDGLFASQITLVPSVSEQSLTPEKREQRNALERELAALREKKAEMPEAEYLSAVEAVLLKIARLYQPSGS